MPPPPIPLFERAARLLPALPALGRTGVVIFEVDLAVASAAPLEAILDEEERERARRFVFAADRRRYQAAHAALRQAIAHYLDADPRTLRFERGSHGKPRLAAGMPGGVEFNLSHSGERALIAIAPARAVGVDIETHRSHVDIEALARRVLSPAEQAAFSAMPPESRAAAFFRAWARKESFIKAIGEGLACPLDSFDVSLDEEIDSALMACRHLPAGVASWTTTPLDVGPGAAAALTAAGRVHLQARDASVWVFG